MNTNIRKLLSLGLPLFCSLVLAWQIIQTKQGNQHMIENENRLLLSTALILNPSVVQRLVVDKDPTTAILNLNHLANSKTQPIIPANDKLHSTTAWAFRLDRPFLQVDVGLTHLPGIPPIINPLRAIRIWPGYQKNKTSWQQYARPKDIRLIFFRQRLVDSDRQYKIIGTPKLWQSFDITLQDIFDYQEFLLNFQANIPATVSFPGKIDLIWCRLEILNYYAGQGFTKDQIAISELDFIFKQPFRINTPINYSSKDI